MRPTYDGGRYGRLSDAMSHCNRDRIMADRETERRRYKKTAAKFAKLQAMFEEGASKGERRKMSDTWTKRRSTNVTGFHKGAKYA